MKSKESMWNNNDGRLKYRYKGEIIFDDAIDHWKNGVCRLLQISEEEGKRWVEMVPAISIKEYNSNFSELNDEEKILVLKKTTELFFNKTKTRKKNFSSNTIGPCGHSSSVVYNYTLRSNDYFKVVGCKKCQHGWLVKDNDKKQVSGNVVYEKRYFEGKDKGIGYGDYLSQKNWRIEKARRLIRQLEGMYIYAGLRKIEKPNVLDVGSGYGFFRKVLNEKGWHHDGVDLSAYAINICEKEFHFTTFKGTIEEFYEKTNQKYDIITMWDIIEHVDDPIAMLCTVNKLLKKDGICAIRTPNLMSIERGVLGDFYYSLKAEHVNYFSPQSILLFVEKADLYPIFLTTESHFFRGFLGHKVNIFEKLLKGSDIFIVIKKISDERWT